MLKNKKVTFTLIFDEEGNISKVLDPDGKACRTQTLIKAPLDGVISMATLVLTNDDDPCIIQGGRRWCWR